MTRTACVAGPVVRSPRRVAACARRIRRLRPAPVVVRNADPALFAAQVYDARWWRQFDDPVLERLEDDMLRSNHDVRMAVARVEQARAIFRDVELDRFPTGTVGAASIAGSRRFRDCPRNPCAPPPTGAGFDAFWEVDLFGGVRSAVRSAAATAAGLEASLEDVRVIVAAEVARHYFELRGLQQQLAVAERSLTNQRETLRLTEVRRDAGIGEEQDVASAAARVAAHRSQPAADPPGHRRARTRPGCADRHAAWRAYRRSVASRVSAAGQAVVPGRSGAVAAEASRHPGRRTAPGRRDGARRHCGGGPAAPGHASRDSLASSPAAAASSASADSRAWAVTPALSWAALDLGSARARLRGVEAATRESLAAYEQTVLRAIEETENALVAYREQQATARQLGDQARESGRAASIARARYREGVADFLALLDAERTQLQAEDAVAQAEAGVFTSVVAVYKALGGISECCRSFGSASCSQSYIGGQS